MNYILAFDIGTSAVKASLVSEELEILNSVSIAYDTNYPSPMLAEQDPKDWWRCACLASKALAELCPKEFSGVVAIGTSGHMLGSLAVDSDGQPLLPAIIHCDNRAMNEAEFLISEVGEQILYEKTGNVLSAAASLCKAIWVKKNQPEIYRKTFRFLQSKDYLVCKMTGNPDSTDFSDSSHGLLIDIHKKEYLEDVFSLGGISKDKFPQLHKSSDIVGTLTGKAAEALGLKQGIPVVAGGGDGACANIGAGISKCGDIYCSLGTTAWLAYNQDVPYVDPKRRVFNIMSLDGETYGVFGTMQSAGRAVSWAQSLFGVESAGKVDQIAAKAPPGSNGLIFLPYLDGERSPVFDPMATGVFFGISSAHDASYFLRATLEGVACGLSDILDAMRETGNIEDMRIIGGGAKSAFWKQIIADLCQITIHDVSTSSTGATSLGAAAAAGVGAGIFRDFQMAAEKIKLCSDIVPDKRNEEVYRLTRRKYKQLYPGLQEVFHTK